MSTVTHQHLLEVLKLKCGDVAADRSKIKGYERELLKTLAEIVGLERTNQIQPGHIQKSIGDKVDALSRIIFESKSDTQ
jgi:hypothetical protein